MLISETIPLMATLELAIGYGVYAAVRIVLSIRGIRFYRKMDLYTQTLGYMGWISTIYTLCLFTHYILLAKHAYDYTWPCYLVIFLMGLTTFVVAVWMLVKAIRVLRQTA